MTKIPARIIEKLILLACALMALILSGCSSYQLALLNNDDPMYPVEYVIPIAEDTKIDTLSYSQLRWKLRTDFNFRWDYAQFAMNQPYNWYSSFSYNVWRPFNSFDVYFNRYNFWYDWAFNYPYYWGYSSWHNPWRHHWYRPYNWGYSWYNGPWHNQGYNIIWNSSRENNNIAYVSGRRGSRNFNIGNNSNIENNVSTSSSTTYINYIIIIVSIPIYVIPRSIRLIPSIIIVGSIPIIPTP